MYCVYAVLYCTPAVSEYLVIQVVVGRQNMIRHHAPSQYLCSRNDRFLEEPATWAPKKPDIDIGAGKLHYNAGRREHRGGYL